MLIIDVITTEMFLFEQLLLNFNAVKFYFFPTL